MIFLITLITLDNPIGNLLACAAMGGTSASDFSDFSDHTFPAISTNNNNKNDTTNIPIPPSSSSPDTNAQHTLAAQHEISINTNTNTNTNGGKRKETISQAPEASQISLVGQKQREREREGEKGHFRSKSGGKSGYTSSGASSSYSSWSEILAGSKKIITVLDLAGLESYIRTTVTGLVSQRPDYALLAVSAKQGVQGMTLEHLSIAVALSIPVFIMITMVDLASDSEIQATKSEIYILYITTYMSIY